MFLFQIVKLYNTDPQATQAQPKILNFRKFAKQCMDIRSSRPHKKIAQEKKYQHHKLIDSYGYLKCDLEHLVNGDSYDLNEQMDAFSNFLLQESFYADTSLLLSNYSPIVCKI